MKLQAEVIQIIYYRSLAGCDTGQTGKRESGMDTKEDKIHRILDLYTRLLNGDAISKRKPFILALQKKAYSVTSRAFGIF